MPTNSQARAGQAGLFSANNNTLVADAALALSTERLRPARSRLWCCSVQRRHWLELSPIICAPLSLERDGCPHNSAQDWNVGLPQLSLAA